MSTTSVLVPAFLLLGALFMLLSAVGILRMPDLYTRMSATSKAASLGAGCMLTAVAIYFHETAVTTRVVATIAFIFLTVPVAAHVIGRAAYRAGVPLWKGTSRDDLTGRYGPEAHGADDPEGPQ